MRSAGRRPAGSRTSSPSAAPRASPTTSPRTQWSSSGSGGRWPLEGLLVDRVDEGMRELGASAGQWRPPAPITHHDRRDDRSCGGAAKQQLPIGRPADGESSGWSSGYLPVVRRARVGLLPSRSGRITMYAAATNRPPQATRSPKGARRCCADGVLARELGRCLPARPPRLPSTSCPPRAASSPMPFRNRRAARPEPGQPGSQETAVIARGDRRVERTGESCEVQGSCGVPPGGVPGPWHGAGWVRRSAGRPGVRPSKAQDGVKVRLETVADGLPTPLPRVPAAERPSPRR
jgi:hypothetical protein